MQILSWNVNGLRASVRKGFLDWLQEESPTIMCLQETKALAEQLPQKVKDFPPYQSFFSAPERKGYSGVATYTKIKPLKVFTALLNENFNREGRIICLKFANFTLYNVYFPNGKASKERLNYKMDFYEAFAASLAKPLAQGEKIIVVGDVNTAHREIDLARPKANENTSGFLPQERAWIDDFLAKGFIDTFREFDQRAEQYSWWDMKTRARDRNVGWRIDYIFVSQNLKSNLKNAFIKQDVYGSDHCPVGIELDI